jgi:DNA polymerase-3 subunit beta
MLLRAPEPSIIELVASDGQITFMAQLAAQVHSGGTVILPGKMLSEISKYWTGDSVAVEHEGTTAKIMASRSQFVLSASPGEKYPSWDDAPEPLGEMDAEDFSDAVKKITPASGKNIPGIAYGAVRIVPQLGQLHMVCTDGSSMAVMSPSFMAIADLDKDPSPVYHDGALVPVGMTERFARITEGKVRIGWSKGLVSVKSPGLTVVSRQISGDFPKWEKVLQAAPDDWVTADTSELTRLVKTAQLASSDDRVELTFDGNDLNVSAAGQEGRASGYTDTDFSGETISFLFGGNRVLDALRGCGDQVRIGFTAPLKAVYFRSEDLTFLVQPRRDLKEEAS